MQVLQKTRDLRLISLVVSSDLPFTVLGSSNAVHLANNHRRITAIQGPEALRHLFSLQCLAVPQSLRLDPIRCLAVRCSQLLLGHLPRTVMTKNRDRSRCVRSRLLTPIGPHRTVAVHPSSRLRSLRGKLKRTASLATARFGLSIASVSP